MEEKDNKSKAFENLKKIKKTLESVKIDNKSLGFLVVELEKLNQFTLDIAIINNFVPSIAENLRKAFHSKRAAVFAEASLMAGIVRREPNMA